MKKERGDCVRKQKINNRGITFVELLIAIAISTIIMGAATLFLGAAHKNYNHATAQIDLQSESQILMEQMSMWVMEGNRVEIDKADPKKLVVYQIPSYILKSDLPEGTSASMVVIDDTGWEGKTPEEKQQEIDKQLKVTKRIFWVSSSGRRLYMKKIEGRYADVKTATVSSKDETQEACIGEYVTEFTPTVNTDASGETASVSLSIEMQYMKQNYKIQNEFKVRNALK